MAEKKRKMTPEELREWRREFCRELNRKKTPEDRKKIGDAAWAAMCKRYGGKEAASKALWDRGFCRGNWGNRLIDMTPALVAYNKSEEGRKKRAETQRRKLLDGTSELYRAWELNKHNPKVKKAYYRNTGELMKRGKKARILAKELGVEIGLPPSPKMKQVDNAEKFLNALEKKLHEKSPD